MTHSDSCWMLWAELFNSDSFFSSADSEKRDMMKSEADPRATRTTAWSVRQEDTLRLAELYGDFDSSQS